MPTNLRLSGAQTSFRSESDIRFDYTNPTRLVAASNAVVVGTLAVFYSGDTGGSWLQSTLPTVAGDALQGDPAVDWTSDGTAWALCVGLGMTGNVIRSFKSIDAGQTWTFDSIVSGTHNNVDKPMLWVDHSPTSPFRDNLYALWWNNSPTFLSRRVGPAGAWEAVQQLSGAETTAGSDGGDVKTNAFGDVFAFWPSQAEQTLQVAKSTNGGALFGAPVRIANTFGSFLIGLPAQASRTVLLYISGGAYRTATLDLVYAIWMDLAGGPGCNTDASEPGSNTASTCKTRIWFSRSTTGGTTWEAPRKINDQPGLNDQFFPRLVVDDTTGLLMVVYYDTVSDPGRLRTDIWMQTSADNGVSWSGAQKITTSPTDETSPGFNGNQYGDYIGMTGINGNFFACWTDRRSGGFEEIWGALIATKSCAFIVERSTLGQDEIDARRGQPGGPVVRDAFRVVVDGFTAAQIGVAGPTSTLAVASPLATGMAINCTGNTSATGGYGPEVQRFTFHYIIDFGPTDDAFLFPTETLLLTVNVAVATVSASAQIQLIKQPNPFILHGDPTWLSIDLRTFSVRAGETKFGVMMGADASAAPTFIRQVMAALTAGDGSAGGQTFIDDVPVDQRADLFIYPNDGPMGTGPLVFNFALAKVHYIGLIGATNVRVFFRLFQAQTTSTAFDSATTYRRAPTNPSGQPIPRAGIQGTEYVTIPCFATARVNSAAVSMDQQTDDPNVQPFMARPGGAEVDVFYGAWLDINQPFAVGGSPNNVLPVRVPTTDVDGPFLDPLNPPLSIQQAILRNPHQCLVAEIAFDPVSIPFGKDPGNWDKLAQRNLAWSDIPNPGVDGSRVALNTFEIRPTPAGLASGETPDELMIDWGNTPDGSLARIYLPAIDVAEVLSMAAGMYAAHRLERHDEHTLQCPTGGITYIPIPAASGSNYAGLLSVELPEGVREGQVFNIFVRQVTNAFGQAATSPPIITAAATGAKLQWRRVLGAFQLSIPVSTRGALLGREERTLSVLRWIAEAIPVDNRWYPVFHRYLDQIGGRVRGFGGNPDEITPSPNGTGRAPVCSHKTRWLVPLILAPLLVLIALAPPVWSAPVAAAAIVLLLAATCYWLWRCKPSLCDFLSVLILGVSVAYLVLGIVVLLGHRSLGSLLMLALLSVINGLLLFIAMFRRCCWKCAETAK